MQRIMRMITNKSPIRIVPLDQTLLYAGEVPVEVYILKEGIVKMYDVDGQGNEKILHLLRPNAVVPLAFFSGPDHATHWYYTTLTDCEMYILPIEVLTGYIRRDSEMAIYLMNWFSLEVHELLARLSSLELTNTRGKVMAVLKMLAARYARPANGAWRRVTFPVSHKLLASMIGVSREGVTLALGELEREGLVRTREFVTLDISRKLLRMQVP